MPYERPRPMVSLTRSQKISLLQDYFLHSREVASLAPSELNLKLPRAALADVIDDFGTLLLRRSRELAQDAGPVRDFLERHVPPGDLARLLPSDFRAFCLVLNALKQWIAAEQAATDRYLLGGTARQTLKGTADVCTLTGRPLSSDDVELHHPVRDGRPPIPTSKAAHAELEGQSRGRNGALPEQRRYRAPSKAEHLSDESPAARLQALKRSRPWSWVMLRRGCLDLMGQDAGHSTPAVAASSRTFARKAVSQTGQDLRWIIAFLDERGL